MSVVVADLLTPAGEVNGALLYPALSSAEVTTLLGGYITASGAVVTALATDPALADEAARAWIYYRVWNDVVQRLTLNASSTSLAGEVSTSFLQTQINEWIKGRDAWRATFLALIDSKSTAEAPGVSRAIETVIRF